MRELAATDPEAREELRDEIHRDGCVLLRSVIDPATVGRLADSVEELVAELGLTSTDDVLSTFRATRTPFYRALQRDAAFHEPAADPRLRAVVATLVGSEVLAHPRRLLRTIPPGVAELVTPPHQDFAYIRGTAETYTCWVPLRACTPDSGALRILVGSHAEGLLPHTARDAFAGSGVDVDDDDPRWASASFEPGDVVVFHSLTVHGGSTNSGTRWRLSADYRFQSAHAPVDPRSLLPAGHPAVPDWDELLAGTEWDRERLIGTPRDLTISMT